MELAQAVPAPAAVPTPEDVRREPADAELLRRIAERDADAFDVLYERYARAVYGLALRRLGDRQRAEDALQETFAAIWRSARSYKPERGPGAPGCWWGGGGRPSSGPGCSSRRRRGYRGSARAPLRAASAAAGASRSLR